MSVCENEEGSSPVSDFTAKSGPLCPRHSHASYPSADLSLTFALLTKRASAITRPTVSNDSHVG